MSRHYIIPIFVPHKGCPHDCVFCNQKHITGQVSDIDNMFVRNEMQKYLETIPDCDRFVEVSFFGGSFTGLPVSEQISLLKPAKEALDAGRIDAIRLSTRPDYIDDSILRTLKLYGVSIIELGVQSMDEKVLTLSNRGHSAHDVYRASDLIKDYDISLGLQMMVGLPGDNQYKDIKTAEEFVRIKPDMVRIYPALVIKDTYMEHMYRNGEYSPLTLESSIEICSKLYLIFEKADIKIIRIGLQPTENIHPDKDLVSGPFHPAFRELVESKILNDMIKYIYEKYSFKNRPFAVNINERTLSKLYADKKKYFNSMIMQIVVKKVDVIVNNNVPVNSIMLNNGELGLSMSIKDYSLIN